MNTKLTMRLSTITANLKLRMSALKEQKALVTRIGLLILISAGTYWIAIYPLYKSINQRTSRITSKQHDLAWIRSVVGQFNALTNAHPNIETDSQTLDSILTNSIKDSKIAAFLVAQTPDGQHKSKIEFASVSFDDLITWLNQIQKNNGVQIDKANIIQVDQPGLVNATLSLTRAGD